MGILKKASSATSRALRRLFGHASPAGDSDTAAGSTASLSASQNTNHHDPKQGDDNANSTDGTDGTDNTNNTDKSNQEHKNKPDTQQNTSSPTPLYSSVRETSTELDTKSATSTSEAETDTKTDPMAPNPQQPVKGHHVGKENIPPTPETLTDVLTRLSLDGGDSAPVVKPIVPPAPSLQDPAVVAERAMHMRFTEEALDMVSAIE